MTALLLYNRDAIDPAQFAGVDALAVSEPDAAMRARRRPADPPRGLPPYGRALRGRGFEVVEVDVSELQKAEAGVTCMSLIDDRH